MTLNSYRSYQVFKYAVYALLTWNIFWFFSIEWSAASHRLGTGHLFSEIVDGFAATIDTAAWVILLLMFELETHVLEEKHFSRRVTASLHLLRAACYGFIIYAFFGYVARLHYVQDVQLLAGVGDLCTLVDLQWTYMQTREEYAALTSGNCASLAHSGPFYALSGLDVLIGQSDLREARRLAWVDVINSGVWLGVVALLEADVRLQEKNRLNGVVLQVSTVLKLVFYAILFCAAVYWGIKGTFVEFWDAFLWLVAFFFIEMNVVEWRQEDAASNDLADSLA